MLEDLRFSLRTLRRRAGLTLIASLTLALGIGASVAVFSVLNGVILQPLAYPDAQDLVNVWRVDPPVRRGPMSKPDFAAMREELGDAVRVAGYERIAVTAGTDDGATRVPGARVTDGFFSVFGLAPLRGRWLDAGDQSGATSGVVISSGFRRAHFAADDPVIGAELRLNDKRWTVVGVAPPAMDFPAGASVWLPMRLENVNAERGFNFIEVIGRIEQGTRAAVQARSDALAKRLAASFPEDHENLSLQVVGVQDALVSGLRDTLWMLMLAVLLVLLIVCGNVANLLLSRSLARDRELATCAALGAGGGRLARQALIEGLLLAGLGTAGGIAFGALAIDVLLALQPADLPRLEAVAIDLPVLGFAVAAAVLTGCLCGALPAMRARRSDFAAICRTGFSASGGARVSRGRSLIVVAEIALSMALLVSAGLLFTTMQRIGDVDPGFETNHLLTAMIALPAPQPQGIDYQAFLAQIRANAPFLAELERRLGELPGVTAVGFIDAMPLSGESNFSGSARSSESTVDPQRELTVQYRWVSPDYFAAIGVPVLAGEAHGYGRDGHPQVPPGGPVVINEALAAELWRGDAANALGKRIEPGIAQGDFTVGAVVGNARQWSLERDPSPALYLPYSAWPAPSTTTIVLRASVPPLTLADAVRQTVAELDPGVPVFRMRTMEQAAAAGNARRRFTLDLLAAFAAAAVFIAAVGLYGVMTHAVVRRTREIGVRKALGAGQARLLRAFLREGIVLALAGVVVGAGVAVLFTRLLRDLVWGVQLVEPALYLAAGALLLVAALGATLLPAWRAARLLPTEALRHE